MKFISITKSINIRPDWANISGAVLKAGTPLDITGVVANTADAVGILAQDVSKSDAVVAVVTEGTIDLGEIAASYGELDDAAISAMHGITFIDGGGGGMLVRFSSTGSIEPQNHTLAEIIAAAQSEQPVIFQWTEYGFEFCAPATIVLNNANAIDHAYACGTYWTSGSSPMVSHITYSYYGWGIETHELATP